MKAPHWVNYILAEFSSETGLKQLADAGLLITQEDWEQGGFDIYTSIDLRLVDEAEAAARKRIEDLKKQKASNAALVAMRPNTGEILSMIGSVDFSSKEINGQFNAALAYRQPGSSIKPITYAAAMTKGWTAATVIADTQTTFPGANGRGYTPPNPNGRFMGPIAVRMALGSSLNVPAVKTLQFAGIQYMMDLAKDMGVNYQKTADYYGLALTLGGGEVRLVELTSAYTVFANMGNKVDPVSVLKVVRRGETLYEFNPANVKRKQIISPQIAYVLTDILSDNRARLLVFSAQNPLILNRPAAAKTGTTDDFKDSWTVGYTPDLTVGVWIGNNDNSPMLSVAGGIGGGYVWNDFMNRVYGSPELMKAIQMGDTPLQRDFVKPEGVVRVEVCEESGLLPNDKPEFECPKKYTELFPANNVPRQKSTLHQKVKIPRLQLAPDQTPPPATTTTPGSSGIGINDPRYCIAGDTYPPDQVEERMFYNYPPELKEWGIRNGRVPPPTQQCSNYVPPTPTPQPSPTVDPNLPPDLTNPAGPGSTPGVTTTPDQKRTPIPILTNPAPFLTSQPTSAAPKPTPTPGRPATTFPPTPTRNS
jgi:membrane peptidoglycan carboxypeptidase